LKNRVSRAALFVVALHFFVSAQETSWTLRIQPPALVNGSPMLLRVKPPQQLASLQGIWLDRPIAFRLEKKCSCWYALAGVPLDTKPADYPLGLEGTTASGKIIKFSRNIVVGEAHYPSTAIKVAPEYVEPPKETLVRIEQEQAVKKKLFSETSPEPLWSGRFEPPAQAEVSGVFGSARLLNGIKRNQHNGIDFRVHTGTPIHAANAGTVVLARNLYFEGNCVAVDHGQGLVTLYLHLSQFKVKEGDTVKRGQIVGLSGGTGRATAPHLHFAVRWQGEYLNPAVLLRLTPP
jgi:murein DD-endopeptidase MepM/ murein hydrolase activator NlpD